MAHNPRIKNQNGVVTVSASVEVKGNNNYLSASQVNAVSGTGNTLTTSTITATDKQASLLNVKRSSRTITSDTTISASDQLLLVDASAGAVTVTIPTPDTLPYSEFMITKIDTSANPVNIVSDVPYVRYAYSIANPNNYGSSDFNGTGDCIVVGANIFNKAADGSWYLAQSVTGSKADIVTPTGFGCSCAINYSGSKIVVGNFFGSNNGTTYPGIAYVFTSGASGWVETSILLGSKATSDSDNFGYSVDMNAAGNRIAVAAPRDANGAPANTGIVYIFNTGSGNTWTQSALLIGSLAIHGDEWFGRSISFDSAGNKIAVGAPYDDTVTGSFKGLIYVFRGPSTWTQEAILTSSLTTTNMGSYIKMNGNGDKIVADGGDGYIRIFESSSLGWREGPLLPGSSPVINSQGNRIVASGYLYNSGSSGWKKSSGTWYASAIDYTGYCFASSYSNVDFYCMDGPVIDNSISVSLTTGSNTLNFVSDGSNWRII